MLLIQIDPGLGLDPTPFAWSESGYRYGPKFITPDLDQNS